MESWESVRPHYVIFLEVFSCKVMITAASFFLLDLIVNTVNFFWVIGFMIEVVYGYMVFFVLVLLYRFFILPTFFVCLPSPAICCYHLIFTFL